MGWLFSLEDFDSEIANIIDRFDEILRELREFEDDRIRKACVLYSVDEQNSFSYSHFLTF